MSLAAREFPQISDYAFLSDSHTAALVAPDGSVEWLCVPRFDSPSLFGAMLDRGAGHFRLRPHGTRFPVARRYLPGTNILETTWMTEDGWLVVRDALSVAPWRERIVDGRPPTDHAPDGVLLRLATCIDGEVDVEVDCAPAPGYATEEGRWSVVGGSAAATGAGAGTSSADMDTDRGPVRLLGGIELELDGAVARGRRRLRRGEACVSALAWNPELAAPTTEAGAEECFRRTADFWRRWLAAGEFPDHPWRAHLQRSALVLKGLIHAPTGATVAAATTSLPETPGGERNWDYRFTWVRDATFTLWGLHVLGFDEEAADFLRFMLGVCRRGESQIMYGIGGERELEERTLDHLSGYGGARPVRIGNAAHTQRQLDVYGALLDSLYLHSKAAGRVDDDVWEIARMQVEAAASQWHLPDQGIWEARGDPRHYVSSKLLCWVALDRGARLAERRGEDELEGRWRGIAAEIRDQILDRGVSDRGVFRQHYDTDALDASCLLVPLVRFLPPDDERVRATVLAIASELVEGGLVLRYRIEETDDGLRGEEATFTICSFWLVSALSEIGEAERARRLCERLLGLAGPLDLYAEELDPHTGRHWGNYPQAFTHLSLINAVSHVIADERAERRRGEPTAVLSELRPGAGG